MALDIIRLLDQNCSKPNQTRSASVYRGPFGNPSKMDTNSSKTGPAVLAGQFRIHLNSFQTGSRMAPCNRKDQIHFHPFGTGPV